MAERGMNPYIKAFLNFIRSFRPSNFTERTGKLIGTDHLGNKYFESKIGSRTSRYYETPSKYHWDEELPPEWIAWLRRLRKEPPTPEELEQNLQRREILKQKFSNKSELVQPNPQQKYPRYAEYEENPGSKYKFK